MATASQFHLLPQIADLKSQFEANTARAATLWSNASGSQLIWQPRPNAWSATECLGHLTITTHEYLKFAECAVDEAPSGQGPFRADWLGGFLARNMEPPYKFKVKTAPNFVWKELDSTQAISAFRSSQKMLISELLKSNGKALDKVKVSSPFSALVRYNLYSMFLILAAHQRRHLWQAEQVLAKAPR